MEVDREALSALRTKLMKDAAWRERQQRFAPLREVLGSNRPDVDGLILEATVQSLKANWKLEQSLAMHEESMRNQANEYEQILNRARRRTQALRHWLEALA